MTAKASAKDFDPANGIAGLSFYRHAIPVLIGFAPVLTMLLSWASPGTAVGIWQVYIKALALPVICIELLTIALAMLSKGRWMPSEMPVSRRACFGALICIVIGTAVFTATSKGAAFLGTALWLVHCSFAWSVFKLSERYKIDARTVVTAMIAGFVMFSALLMIFVGQVTDPSTFNWYHHLPGLDNIRRGAYFAVPIAGLCIARLASNSNNEFILAAVGYIMAIAVIFWSGARGGAIAVAATYCVAIVLFPRLRTMRMGIILCCTSGAAIALAWLYSIHTGFDGFWRMLPAQWGGDFANEGSDFSSGRTDLWLSTWQTIMQRPLLGHGEGQTIFIVPVGLQIAVFHPHNLLLQLLLAWGIVGTSLVLYLAIPMIGRAINNARRSPAHSLAPFMAMLALLLYSGIDGTLFHVHAVSIFALCTGLICFDRNALWRSANN